MSPYVDHCFNRLRFNGVFEGVTKLHIFSDGAGKHFGNKFTTRWASPSFIRFGPLTTVKVGVMGTLELVNARMHAGF